MTLESSPSKPVVRPITEADIKAALDGTFRKFCWRKEEFVDALVAEDFIPDHVIHGAGGGAPKSGRTAKKQEPDETAYEDARRMAYFGLTGSKAVVRLSHEHNISIASAWQVMKAVRAEMVEAVA